VCRDASASTNTIHALVMAVLVVAAAFVVGVVVFDLEGTILPSESTPSASIEFGYAGATDTLTITHRGGDALDPANVVVLNQGFQRVGGWNATDAITAGDATVIENVTRETTVYVMFETDEDSYVILATWNPRSTNGTTTTTLAPGRDPASLDGAVGLE
jgi:hypothetical protein